MARIGRQEVACFPDIFLFFNRREQRAKALLLPTSLLANMFWPAAPTPIGRRSCIGLFFTGKA